MASPPIPWKHVRDVLLLFAPLWCGAGLLFGTAGVVYSWVKDDLWSARQPMLLRDEGTTSAQRLGRFASQTELKAAQETILEMAQNPEVVAAALRQIGPPAEHGAPTWPSATIVDSVANERVNIRAPQGSEFGETEVVYLHVRETSRERAAAFCRAVFGHLTEHLRKVRRARADSIIEELTQGRDLARTSLEEAMARLHDVEVEFGSDLGELRNLNDPIAGDGTIRRELEAATRDLQQAELELRKSESLHELLVAGLADPRQLLISGDDLLTSQPSLEKLKDGLIEAQLESSRLFGVYTTKNPKLKAALQRESEIQQRIREETAAVIQAMEPSLELQRERISRLESKQHRLRGRLQELAEVRTRYAKLDAEVRSRTDQLAEAEKALSEARASRTAALSTNLLVEFGPAQVSEHPVGISGGLMTLGSIAAGLIFGLGVVFLVAPGPTEVRYGRRWGDYLGGRRATDQLPSAPPSPAVPSRGTNGVDTGGVAAGGGPPTVSGP